MTMEKNMNDKDKLDSRETVELTIRAAQLAKEVLGLVGLHTRFLARAHCERILDQLRGLAEFLQNPESP